MARPKVAVIATVYFPGSHADAIATRLMEGYELGGVHTEPRVEVASMYLEQLGTRSGPNPRPDMGMEISDRHGVPRFPTVAQAVGCGTAGVNVDGVIIIGEHGDYEFNEYEQKLYPRRRLFDATVKSMISGGRTVPIFNDKHLAWTFADALAMYDTARQLGIPLLAGSSVPLAWRIPTGAQWPLGASMNAAVGVGYGPTENYGFHILEGLQAHVERRMGGETGVSAVEAFSGEAAVKAVHDGTVDAALLSQALDTFVLDEVDKARAMRSVKDVFLVDYADETRAAAVNCDDVIQNFGAACRGPEHEMACQMWLQGKPRSGHFTFLVRQIEAMICDGVAPYPIERTLLTTGMLDAAMRSRHEGGIRRETPELAVSYQPAADVPDTGVSRPLPEEPDKTF